MGGEAGGHLMPDTPVHRAVHTHAHSHKVAYLHILGHIYLQSKLNKSNLLLVLHFCFETC